MTTNSILLNKTMTRIQGIVPTKILISQVKPNTLHTETSIKRNILNKMTILAFLLYSKEANLWSYSGVFIFIWPFKFLILCIDEWTRMIENFGNL